MTTATMKDSAPLLPSTAAAHGSPSMFTTWVARRRALRQRRAFDRALSTMEPRMAAELLSAARHDS